MADNTQQDESTRNRQRILIIVLAVVVALLGAGLAYVIIDSSQEKEQITQEKKELNTELKDTYAEIDAIQKELREANLDAENKEKRIQELVDKISTLEGRLNKAIASQRYKDKQIAKLKEKIEELKLMRERFESRLAKLNEKNEELTQSNTQLNEQVDTLSERTSELEAETEEKQKKLDEAAANLQAGDFNYTSFDKRGNKEESGIKIERDGIKGGKLRLCFHIMKNPVAEIGRKDIYVVMKDSRGKVLSNNEEQAGPTFESGGKEMTYTAQTKVNYDRKRKEVCVDYSLPKGEKFDKGKHIVEVYTSERKLGEDWVLVVDKGLF